MEAGCLLLPAEVFRIFRRSSLLKKSEIITEIPGRDLPGAGKTKKYKFCAKKYKNKKILQNSTNC